MFADCLDLDDINSLVRTSRALNWLLTPYMYRLAKDLESRYGRPYFLEAVDAGNLTAVSHFIGVGTSVNMSDTMECLRPTALHCCVLNGNMEIGRLLIQHGVNMSPVNFFGFTPLHYAVSRSETWVRLLVDAGADIIASSGLYGTILYTATLFGTTSIVQLLLHRGAIPTICNSDGDTLLHCPPWDRTAGLIRLILQVGGNIEATNVLGETHSTVLDRGAATVGLFLEAGLNIDATNKQGETPLHHAAKYGSVKYVKELLKWGADVDAIDNEGRTPLQVFLRWSPSTSAACHILHHETPPEKCASKGSQACDPTCQSVEFVEPVVDLLLSAGANIRASENSTRCPLDWAAVWLNR
jgi:hypothetical protein